MKKKKTRVTARDMTLLNGLNSFYILSSSQTDYIAELKEYDVFVQSLRKLWLTAASDMKSRIIKRLIHKVEVGADSVVIHYNVDKRNIVLESKNSNFFNLNGSNSLTNGA